MEDDSSLTHKKEEKPASAVMMNMLFSHVGLFFVVALYASLGAMAFIQLERPYEERQYVKKQLKAMDVNSTINYLAQLLWAYQGNATLSFDSYNETVYKDMKNLEDFIIKAVENNSYDGTVYGWDWKWTFAKSLLLTMTIITTIGYGHISPETFYGQIFCMIYAIVGCPLLLLFLANIGEVMAHSFIYIYSRCCCRWCRSQRYESEMPPGGSKRHMKLLIDDDVGKEEYMPTDTIVVPITVNLVLLTGYIVMGAVLFSNWEDWDLASSTYFTFITISTIGYGDYVPNTAMVEDISKDVLKTMKMLVVVLYILFGMAMLSMAINLMQDQLVEKCRWLAREIGCSKDPNDTTSVEADIEDGKKKTKKTKKNKKKGKKDNNEKDDGKEGSNEDESVSATVSDAPTRPDSAASVLPGSADD